MVVPDPPELVAIRPLIFKWPADKPFLRCHHSKWGATEFNPGEGNGRFHPLRSAEGESVPTLYGSNSIDGALSETVFHDVPIRGPAKAIQRSSLLPLQLSTLAPKRILSLIQLHGHGLRRLNMRRTEIIECDADQYVATRRWGEILHRVAPDGISRGADGLVWMSRQHDSSTAIVLFGDRMPREMLEVVRPPTPLALGPGFEEVRRAAEEADIMIVE